MKKCEHCDISWQEDNYKVCPYCGRELTVKQQTNESVSLGDGNAISGGIHISKDVSQKDDHSISSSNNTTNSNNSTVNNTTTQNFYGMPPFEQPQTIKSQEDILLESESKYREICRQILSDGILTISKRNYLEEQRFLLNLSKETATKILNEVNSIQRHNVINMGTIQRVQLDNLKSAVGGNMINNIERFLPQIKINAEIFQDEELQYFYHLVLAALEPEKCVEIYTQRQNDNYWMSFWVYVSFHKLKRVVEAGKAMIELRFWDSQMPEGNSFVLATLGSLVEGDLNMALEMFEETMTREYSPLLTDIVNVMKSLLYYNPDSNCIEEFNIYKFYIDSFFNENYQSLVKEEERRRKEEEERRRKEEEERRRKEEEERKRREEEERKRREEEERKRKEEEERKRREEEERRRREEEERKRREEEERKRREEEERKRREEEERKRREEEERKRKEEERKRKEEEERKRKEEEERKRKVKRFCANCGRPIINVEAVRCKFCGHELRKKVEPVKVEPNIDTNRTISGHEYVDLGLSVKWATCNVGARKPEDYGNYYVPWSRTSERTERNKELCSSSSNNVKGNLKHDAARANWGGTWRLPTKEECRELLNKCVWEWTEHNGVKGCKVTGANGNSIFFPAAGVRYGSSHFNTGTDGYYLSSTPYEGNRDYVCYISFDSIYHNLDWMDRSDGRSVRPVTE